MNTGITRDKPLWWKLYFLPVYTDVAKAIGYGGCLYRELDEKLEPLYRRFGKSPVQSATWYLLTFEGQLRTNVSPLAKVELRAEVRKLCFQLLGPAPGDPEYQRFHPDRKEEKPEEPKQPDAPPEGYAAEAQRKNRKGLHYMLRNARKKLKQHGEGSYCGKEARKEIAAVEVEMRNREIEIPPEGQETAKWDRKAN